MARVQKSVEHRTRPKDRWRYGLRHCRNGDIIPLTEDDLLDPREGDKVAQTDEHDDDRAYLKFAFRRQCAGRPRLRIFSDHIINFERGGVRGLCPDIAVVEGDSLTVARGTGVFYAGRTNALVHCTVELTSDSTRRTDLHRKPPRYLRAGVPLHIIADLPYSHARKPLGLLPYRAGPNGYELLPLDAHGRFWIEIANLALGIENGRIACYDAHGERIGDSLQVDARAEQEKALREQAEARAEQEKARAEQEKARAEQEKARAEQAEARLRELEAQLKKPKRTKK